MWTVLVGAVCLLLLVSCKPAFELHRRRRLRRLAVALCAALDDEGAPYWLDFGTLLGVVREGDIILGDNDVDVCVADGGAETDAMLRRVARRLAPRGYTLTLRRWSHLTRVHDGSLFFADVYHNVRDGETWRGATGPAGRHVRTYRDRLAAAATLISPWRLSAGPRRARGPPVGPA